MSKKKITKKSDKSNTTGDAAETWRRALDAGRDGTPEAERLGDLIHEGLRRERIERGEIEP